MLVRSAKVDAEAQFVEALRKTATRLDPSRMVRKLDRHEIALRSPQVSR